MSTLISFLRRKSRHGKKKMKVMRYKNVRYVRNLLWVEFYDICSDKTKLEDITDPIPHSLPSAPSFVSNCCLFCLFFFLSFRTSHLLELATGTGLKAGHLVLTSKGKSIWSWIWVREKTGEFLRRTTGQMSDSMKILFVSSLSMNWGSTMYVYILSGSSS